MNLFLIFAFAISLLVGDAFGGKCRTYHKVKRGESLWLIADRYNLYVKDLLRANPGLRKRKYLKIGQRICIPYRKGKDRRYKGYLIYRVRPGDSLQKIGKRFGVSWREIKRANGLRSDIITDSEATSYA